jgi:hypothetical protein
MKVNSYLAFAMLSIASGSLYHDRLWAVLRILDVYPGSELFPSWIPDPRSASKNLSILTQKTNKKMVSKL